MIVKKQNRAFLVKFRIGYLDGRYANTLSDNDEEVELCRKEMKISASKKTPINMVPVIENS